MKLWNGVAFRSGETMFHIINTYTRASQYDLLSADASFKLQKIGGNILTMLNQKEMVEW